MEMIVMWGHKTAYLDIYDFMLKSNCALTKIEVRINITKKYMWGFVHSSLDILAHFIRNIYLYF